MTDVTFTQEQQALVDKLVGEARVKARDKATTDAATLATKEKDAADQAALAASNEWQQLAEKHGARVKELEPLEAKAVAYEKLIDGMLKDKIKVLGDAAKTAVSGLPDSMSAITKLGWLNDNEGLFQGLGDGVGTPNRQTQTVPKTPSKPGEISKYPIRL